MDDTAVEQRPRNRVVVDTTGPEWQQNGKQQPQQKKRKRQRSAPKTKERDETVEQFPLEMQPLIQAARIYAQTMRQCGKIDCLSVVYEMLNMLGEIKNSDHDPEIRRVIEWGQKRSTEFKLELAKVYDQE